MPEQRTFIQRTPGQFVSRQLGQLLNTATESTSLYSPADGVSAIVKRVHICNTTASPRVVRLFHDEDGSTYDATTALIFDKTIAANDYLALETEISMNNASGNLAVKCDVTAACCFSCYGEEIQTRAR